MVPPIAMCNKHLLWEHVELHMFVGTLKKKKSLDGYVTNNLVEPLAIVDRHTELSTEMKIRNMNHNSPLFLIEKSSPQEFIDLLELLSYLPKEIQENKVNTEESKKDLAVRCEECRKRLVHFRIL